MECFQFPSDNPQAAYDLLERLRDRFGRRAVSEEDGIRLESLRRSARLRQAPTQDGEGFSDILLEQMEATITLSFIEDRHDRRSFELVNKTNQFNLNGMR